MKKEDIHLWDVQRILLGNAPVEFLIEVLVRSAITYVFLLVIVRLMGKRMSGKLTYTEMAVMLMLGAIVSSAMLIPERGIVEGCFVLVLVMLIQRFITWWMFRSSKVEDRVLGTMYLLVKDGVLQIADIEKEYITRTQLFGMLRSRKVNNLGAIKRLYLETSGNFTLYKYKEPLPGLSLYITEDQELYNSQLFAENKKVCKLCGVLYEASRLPDSCYNCKQSDFVIAVTGC